MSRHAGQVAFPGGRSDPGELPWETALREAREEIGLEPERVTIAGLSTPYETVTRSEEHTSELQSRQYLVCRLLLEKKKKHQSMIKHNIAINQSIERTEQF